MGLGAPPKTEDYLEAGGLLGDGFYPGPVAFTIEFFLYKYPTLGLYSATSPSSLRTPAPLAYSILRPLSSLSF